MIRMAASIFVTFLIFAPSVSSSVIVFSSTPATVLEGLTDEAFIRCSLNDTAASANVIGRRRDATRTTDNVEQVSSIILMKDGVDVASVSQAHQARTHVNATNMQVTGDVSMISGERGYLSLSLQDPTPAQVGEYHCEVSALSPVGHTVIFTSDIEINMAQPNITDLVHGLNNAKHEIHTLQELVSDLSKDVTCYTVGSASLYHGTVSQTKSGKTCQSWSAQTPHGHSFGDTLDTFPADHGHFPGNLCRAPSDDTVPVPWCYTVDPATRWEKCDIPKCT